MGTITLLNAGHEFRFVVVSMSVRCSKYYAYVIRRAFVAFYTHYSPTGRVITSTLPLLATRLTGTDGYCVHSGDRRRAR